MTKFSYGLNEMAKDVAEKALDEVHNGKSIREWIKIIADQDSCEDCISREAIDEVKELMTDINGNTVYAVKMSDIRQLPSVTPQEPKVNILNEIAAEIKRLSPKPTPEDVIDRNAVKNIVWETLYDGLRIINKYRIESEESEE